MALTFLSDNLNLYAIYTTVYQKSINPGRYFYRVYKKK